jgi:pimeloyl-ACP methyl ester carboxylesterase
MGGYITLAFAEKREQRLKGFGLFHSSSYADSAEKKETREKGITFIKEHGAFAFLRTSTPNLFGPSTKEQDQALIEGQIELCSGFTDAALITYYRSMMERPDRSEVLKNTSLPVLFILGQHDVAVPLQDGLQQCHLPKLSFVHILEVSGHMGMLEETAKSNTFLNNYFAFIYPS